MRSAAIAVKNEFSNYSTRFNTPAKLNNFKLSYDQIEELDKQIQLLRRIPEYIIFKTNCTDIVGYISAIEYTDLSADMKSDIEEGKAAFREIRDSIMDGTNGDIAAGNVVAKLKKIKENYIDIYFDAHKKKDSGLMMRNVEERFRKVRHSAIFVSLRGLISCPVRSFLN